MEAIRLQGSDLDGVRSGDALDFDTRFATVRRRLLAICTPMVGPDEAHDVVQDTYLAARARVEGLRDPDAFEAWLIRIAVNRCMDRHRRGGRIVALDATGETRSAPARDTELRQLIEALPPRERTILVLHYGHGYRLDEIAELMSLSATNVRTIIARARRRLLHALLEADG